MHVAITGGTGFVGTHLARRLIDDGHRVTLVSRTTEGPGRALLDDDAVTFAPASVTDREGLAAAFEGADSVAHLAGINAERGEQTFEAVHVRGTERVVAAAEGAGVSTIVLTSFLRARPDCGSAYHETKWAAEELVRGSDLAHTVLKPGLVYGPGDQFVSNVARTVAKVPVFGSVGLRARRVAPLAISDLVDALAAASTGDHLANSTVPVVGPEELTFGDCVRRIGQVLGRRVLVVPLPVAANATFAWLQERVTNEPIVSRAQVRMLAEGITDPAPAAVCAPLPADLAPEQSFTPTAIERALATTGP